MSDCIASKNAIILACSYTGEQTLDPLVVAGQHSKSQRHHDKYGKVQERRPGGDGDHCYLRR